MPPDAQVHNPYENICNLQFTKTKNKSCKVPAVKLRSVTSSDVENSKWLIVIRCLTSHAILKLKGCEAEKEFDTKNVAFNFGQAQTLNHDNSADLALHVMIGNFVIFYPFCFCNFLKISYSLSFCFLLTFLCKLFNCRLKLTDGWEKPHLEIGNHITQARILYGCTI